MLRLLPPLLLLSIPIASAHPVDVTIGAGCGKLALVNVYTWVDAWRQNPLDPNNPDPLHKFNSAGRVNLCPDKVETYVPGDGPGPLSP